MKTYIKLACALAVPLVMTSQIVVADPTPAQPASTTTETVSSKLTRFSLEYFRQYTTPVVLGKLLKHASNVGVFCGIKITGDILEFPGRANSALINGKESVLDLPVRKIGDPKALGQVGESVKKDMGVRTEEYVASEDKACEVNLSNLSNANDVLDERLVLATAGQRQWIKKILANFTKED